jgi:hypothetical protein
LPERTTEHRHDRNAERFPEDFISRLTREEAELSRSQSVILNLGRGQNIKYLTRDETEALNRSRIVTGSQKHRDPRFPPYAFTEHGAIMAATVLNSSRAVEMSVYVVRAFVKLREMLTSNAALVQKLNELERKLQSHDQAIVGILKAIRGLMNPPAPKRRPIGFTADLKETS